MTCRGYPVSFSDVHQQQCPCPCQRVQTDLCWLYLADMLAIASHAPPSLRLGVLIVAVGSAVKET